MKKILVPTDFSPNANKALKYAAEIAKAAKSTILIVNVCDAVDSPFTDKTIVEQKHHLPLAEATQKELELIKNELIGNYHLTIETQMYVGPVIPSIMEAAQENNADMIIMGTLGNAAFKEKLMGSITAAIIGKATIPVLAVPLLSEWNIPKHILLLANHFDEKTENTKPAFELAALFNAKVTVAIFTDKDKAVAVDYLENTRGLLAYEEKLKAVYKETVIEPEELDGHRFQETLDEYIDEHYVDMLVMLTRKRSFAETVFHKSMTKKMSYHTNIPLLAVPVH